MRERDEAGFTLLELVFALVLLSIGVAALVGVLTTAFRSTGVDLHRTDATAIASQGLTELAAAPQTGPMGTVPRNNITYTLSGEVTHPTAGNGDPNAYPELSVTVKWTDEGGQHSLTQSTARFTSPPTTATTCAVEPVTPIVSTVSGDPSLDVSWQDPGGPVARWQVQVSPDHGATWTTVIDDEPPLTSPPLTHQLEIGGLAANTTYQVQVVAVTTCGALEAFPPAASPVSATTSGPLSGCGSVTLGPSTAERFTNGASAGMLTTDVTVVVTATGSCSTGVAVQADTGLGPVTVPLLPAGPSTYIATLPGLAQPWGLGVHQVQVLGTSQPAPPTALLCVEPEGAGTC
jgi:prepilin-type N-terminal cleavage/methylation domain-containing protein